MLGRISIAKTRLWRVTREEEEILGLRLFNILLPPPGRPRHLRAAARLLRKAGVSRVLAPAGFDGWALLGKYGLTPVETGDFCRSLAAPLALAALQRLEVGDSEATVALRGERVTRPMRMAALALCPRVRAVIISAPVGGEALRAELRREYGVPNLEESWGRTPDVAVHFSETSGPAHLILRLHGTEPDLGRLRIACEKEGLPEDCDLLPLLAVLWETGKLRGEGSEIFAYCET